MKVLVPIDGSDCSYRALRFATDFVQRYNGDLHVVHITDYEGETTETIMDRARSILAEADVLDDPEIVTDFRMSDPRYANAVGKDILRIVEDNDYDHVIMGHHGTGAVGRMILGSAARTVIQAAEIPATVIP
ncbi:MAG: universal stress protein [Halobacteriales archaeon]|nr:universal stress protein [Halobacteriales archaeon]